MADFIPFEAQKNTNPPRCRDNANELKLNGWENGNGKW